MNNKSLYINISLLSATTIGGIIWVYAGLLTNEEVGLGLGICGLGFFLFSAIYFIATPPHSHAKISIRNHPLPLQGNRANNMYISGLSFISLAAGIIIGSIIFEPASLIKGVMISLSGFGVLLGMFVGRFISRLLH